MALRAGYKGIKKKYADEINRGEGGEGGGSYKETILWGNENMTYPPTKPSTIDLTESYDNYDLIFIITGFTSANVKDFQSWLIPVSVLKEADIDPTADTDKIWPIPCNAGGTGQWVRVGNHGDNYTGLSFRYNSDVGVYKVIGVKF